MRAYTNNKGKIRYQPVTKNYKMISWNGGTPIWVRKNSSSLGDAPYLTSNRRAYRLERKQIKKEGSNWVPLCNEREI